MNCSNESCKKLDINPSSYGVPYMAHSEQVGIALERQEKFKGTIFKN